MMIKIHDFFGRSIMKKYNAEKDKSKKHRRPDLKDDDEFELQSEAEDSIITDQDLIGSIYSIKDDIWNFRYSGREGHPGACLNATEALNIASLVHGTDANSNIAKYRHKISYIVEPDSQNGLTKTTAFILELCHIRRRKLLLYHIDRKIGCLDEENLAAIRDRIAQSHPDPWEVDS
ncbi:MAG: hypothetical protein AB7V25_16870 [Mangrovibacterium sp.]